MEEVEEAGCVVSPLPPMPAGNVPGGAASSWAIDIENRLRSSAMSASIAAKVAGVISVSNVLEYRRGVRLLELELDVLRVGSAELSRSPAAAAVAESSAADGNDVVDALAGADGGGGGPTDCDGDEEREGGCKDVS